MEQDGLGALWDALSDILREVSPVFRVTVPLGMLAGAVAVFLIANSMLPEAGAEGADGSSVQMLLFLTLVLVVAGGIVGLAVGALIEVAWKKLYGRKRGQQQPRQEY